MILNRTCLLSLLFSAIAAPIAFAEVTEAQWKEMLSAVGKEDWKPAFALSSKFMTEMKPDDERMPRLRYIYLFTAAGKVSEGQMSFEELTKLTKPLVGQSIVLPYRTCTRKAEGKLNFITQSEEKDHLFIAATNQSGTTVHDFEYITLKEKTDIATHDEQQAAISGTIKSIAPNPNKSAAIVMRLYITDGKLTFKK